MAIRPSQPSAELRSEDYTLLNELWTTIEEQPACIQVRKVLVEQLIGFGWIEAAVDAAREVLKLDPTDSAMLDFLRKHKTSASVSAVNEITASGKDKCSVRPMLKVERVPVPKTDEERRKLESEFVAAMNNLQKQAFALSRDIQVVTEKRRLRGITLSRDEEIERLHSLANWQLPGLTAPNMDSARAVARAIQAENSPEKSLDVAIEDLECVLSRLKSSASTPTTDAIRETLAKRCRIIAATLRSDLQDHPSLALMHLEHEQLGREYQNQETMLGDAISDIPREDFLASEDGYAWSMDELGQAISSNGGVMRNPLSKEMFSITDIQRIIGHPSGKRLAAMQIEQKMMCKGVRPTTIDHLSQLAKVFLADMSEDQIASRQALDEFVAYLATLPQAEQDAIDKLRVPAKDSHTGQAFDCTIGDAVRDAKANKICVHKTGDLLSQAVTYLGQAK